MNPRLFGKRNPAAEVTGILGEVVVIGAEREKGGRTDHDAWHGRNLHRPIASKGVSC